MLSMLDRYNVTWQEPAETDRSAMPLGNGEVGISLWVLADGEIQFYIARTDACTELDRCVKLGKVRIRFTPNRAAADQGHEASPQPKLGPAAANERPLPIGRLKVAPHSATHNAVLWVRRVLTPLRLTGKALKIVGFARRRSTGEQSWAFPESPECPSMTTAGDRFPAISRLCTDSNVKGSRIRVLPAWPKDWNISFKLHAPQGTTVECIYRNGKIEKLVVDPSERLRDVVCLAPPDVQV